MAGRLNRANIGWQGVRRRLSAALARSHGLNATASALKLGYYALQQRLLATAPEAI